MNEAKINYLRVMLIEDSKDFADLLVMAFESANTHYKFDLVSSGEDALEILKKNSKDFDIIITDYLLPGMDGIGLLKELEKEGINIPVVVLTGQGNEKIAVEALKLGASDYLVKDVSAFQFLPTVIDRVYRQKQIETRNLELQLKIVQQNQELAEINRHLMLYSKELIKAEKMASLLFFVRGISHELNNPLAGIVGFSELLLGKVSPGDVIREDLEEIRSCAYRVKDIVSKLAKFCGREKQKPKQFDVHDIIDEVLIFFMPQANSAKIEVEKDFKAEKAVIEGVAVDLQQAIMSFLVNAQEAMHEGGKLCISTQNFDKTIEIAIKDTGEGIDNENIDKVFSPFFSAHKGEKAMGMGLAVTYGIVKENNGEIKVQSKPGQGSVFTIILPLVKS